jgi:hypothetical protein
MMLTTPRAAALALLAPVLLAATAAAPERVVAPPLPGFVVGYKAANAEQSILEEVPAGETVEKWTRMVTTQWFAGANMRVTPPQFLQNVAAGLDQSCPKSKISTPVISTRGGRPAAQMRVDCPFLPSTGKPETFIMLAIAGASDLHVKQVAFRRVPTAADVSWGETFLAGVTLCAAGDKAGACAR